MATASYNIRPRTRNKYKDGRKRNPFMRFFMWILPVKGDGAFEAVRKVIFLGAFICFVYFGGGIVYDWLNDLYNKNISDRAVGGILDFWRGEQEIDPEVYARVRQTNPDMLPEYIVHFDANNDLVGHILIPDVTLGLAYGDRARYPHINYLVYQAEDNRYYLDRTPQHTRSAGGSIFADFRNNFDGGELSGNTVLYGHNIYTGNYFTLLTRYYTGALAGDLSFYHKHPIIHFNSLYEQMDWKVFAVALFNTDERYGEVYRYNFPEFRDKDAFNTFVLDVMDRSVIFTDTDLTYGDHILTLSTCYYPFSTLTQTIESTRVVVFARKVRDGESSHVDTSLATVNRNYLPFRLQQERLGSNWNGRVWNTDFLLSYDG